MMVKRFLSAKDNIIGNTIQDAVQEKVGTIQDVFIDPDTNHPVFVIIAEGGFLGIGSDHVAIPWDILDFNTNSMHVMLKSRIQKVREAPEIDVDKLKNSDQDEIYKLTRYYGMDEIVKQKSNKEDVSQDEYHAAEPEPDDHEQEGYQGSAKVTNEASDSQPAEHMDDLNKMQGTKK